MFDTLSGKFAEAFKSIRGNSKITESNIDEALKQVRTALLEADVSFKVVREFVAAVKEKALGEKVLKGVNPDEQFVKIVHDELARIMGVANEELNLDRKGPIPVMIVGLNGHGKTTFTGKLALHLKDKKKKKVLLVPADTFRPAAKDQLIVHAKNLQVDFLDSDLSMAPKEIALLAMKKAQAEGYDMVLIDTAGRLHVDQDLMQQLKDVKIALEKFQPEVLMVADAMTGQEAVNVAEGFHQAVGLTGVVLSKMDSDSKGGAALSIRYVTGVPIKYISTGEKLKDLELFHPDRLAGRILDMGDVVSLVEKAEEAIDKDEAERMMKNMEKGKFSIDDFMKQMQMMSNLGPMTSLLKMIPGMGGMLREIGDLSPAENEMKKMKVIIQSMTDQEKKNHTLFNKSRLERVARGSGNTVQKVEEFLAKFRQMEKMMAGMMGMMKGGMPGLPGMGMPGGGAQKGYRGYEDPMQKARKLKKKGGGAWGKGYF
jgi:signal recognition particle subunit SRP54